MSLFQTQTIPCPACGHQRAAEVYYSVNADRRPDLRDAVLSEQLQAEICDNCGAAFRIDPELNYLDAGRAQWISVHPLAELGLWEEKVAADCESFAKSYGPEASEGARAFGASLVVRVVFGWAAFREKLVAQAAQLDDCEVELLKTAMLRKLANAPLAQTVELRLVDVVDGELVMCWLDVARDEVVETLIVPMQAYEEIASDTAAWAPLRATMAAEPFVDMQRLMI